MNQKIKIGVIGLGKIWPRHRTSIESLPDDFDLVASCDKVKGKGDFSVFGSMLKMPNLDTVAICTPNNTHYELASQAIRAGKNVIVEKPMTIKTNKANLLKELAEKHNVKIFPIFQVRYNPAVQELLNVVPLLGDLTYVDLRVFWARPQSYYDGWQGDPEQAGTGLHEIGIHYVDILRQVIPDFVDSRVSYGTKNHDTKVDDFFSAHLVLPHGTADIKFTTCIKELNMECSITAIGTNGSVKIGGTALDKIEFWNVEDIPKPRIRKAINPNNYGKYKGSCPNHIEIYKNVADVLLRGAEQDITVDDAIATIELINYLYAKRRKNLGLH